MEICKTMNHSEVARKMNRVIIETNSRCDCDCSICLSTMKGCTVKHLPCGHTFHSRCLTTQFGSDIESSSRCANCRTDFLTSMPTKNQDEWESRQALVRFNRSIEDLSNVVEQINHEPATSYQYFVSIQEELADIPESDQETEEEEEEEEQAGEEEEREFIQRRMDEAIVISVLNELRHRSYQGQRHT